MRGRCFTLVEPDGIASTSSMVASDVLTVPTSFPCSITLMRSARSKTSWLMTKSRSLGFQLLDQRARHAVTWTIFDRHKRTYALEFEV